jgi:hypothetical protein
MAAKKANGKTGKKGDAAAEHRAVAKKIRKGGLKQARPPRYIAIVIIDHTFYHEETQVLRKDWVFWVNMDEVEYQLSFDEWPFEGSQETIVVPAKEPGVYGNWGLSKRYRVDNGAAKGSHKYNPTSGTWNGPPDPPDVSVGDG